MQPYVRLAALLPLALACKNGDVGRLHPDQEFLVREIAVTDSINIESLGVDSPPLPTQESTASDWVTVGRLDGDPSEVLGEVAAVTRDRSGNVFVLDSKASVIRVFGPGGEHKQSIGRPGRGPGDFFHPNTMALTDDGRLLVGDMERRIQVFSQNESRFQLDTTLRVVASPIGLCMLDSLIVVQGSDVVGGSLVQIYDLRGHLIRKFGAVYNSRLEVINLEGARGWIACDRSSGTIAYIPRGLIGELRVFDVSGSTRQLIVLAHYTPIGVRELPNEGYETALPPSAIHSIASLNSFGSGKWLLQVASTTLERLKTGEGYERLYTLMISDPHLGRTVSVRTGQLAFLDDRGPVYLEKSIFPQVSWRRSS